MLRIPKLFTHTKKVEVKKPETPDEKRIQREEDYAKKLRDMTASQGKRRSYAKK